MGEISELSKAVIAGLLIGTAGSLHCLGMCGPLVLGLPIRGGNLARFFSERLVYHLGRISVYAVLGAFGGVLGGILNIGRWQQGISIFLGVIMVLAAFYTSGKLKLSFLERLKLPFSRELFKKSTTEMGYARFLLLGVANGLLPCGLVYIALAGSLAGSGPAWGAMYMSAFGLGSVPILIVISWLGLKASDKLRPMMKRIVQVALFLTGILLTLRGMDLGIPMISPQMKQTATKEQPQMECCSKPSH